VSPVEKILRDLRPSVPVSVRVPALAVAAAAQVCTLGQPAVEILVRTSPVFLLHAETDATVKINNSNGTTSAMGEGMAAPTGYGQKVSATRIQSAQVSKVKGGDARGIPPRGRPV